jgi:hypothetical protein
MARIIPLPRPVRGRAASTAPEQEAALDEDRDLQIAGVLFWLASVARVMAAFVHDEVFGVESSLALLCVLSLPWLSWRSRSSRRLSRRASSASVAERDGMGIIIPFVNGSPESAGARDGD